MQTFWFVILIFAASAYFTSLDGASASDLQSWQSLQKKNSIHKFI